MERVLLLTGLALALVLTTIVARVLAQKRLVRARAFSSEEIWQALAATPDGRPAVVAFSTPSCAACRTAQKPALAQLESRAEGAVRVLEVNAAEQPEVARKFGILTVPATAVLDPQGRLATINNGFAPADRLAAQIGLNGKSETRA